MEKSLGSSPNGSTRNDKSTKGLFPRSVTVARLALDELAEVRILAREPILADVKLPCWGSLVVEHLPHKEDRGGSNPPLSTTACSAVKAAPYPLV